MTPALIALYAAVSASLALPPGLLSAVCFAESKHNPTAIHHDDGTEDSIGLCQIHASTARFIGFEGKTSDLLNPATNAKWAGRYLRYQMLRYHGDTIKAVAAYNAGSYRQGADGLPLNKKYVLKVLRAHRERR